jgi:hypothetical protein
VKVTEKQRQDAAGISSRWKNPLFSEGGCANATVSDLIRQLLTVWYGPDGCYIASNLISGQCGIVATGVTLADLPVERQECRSFEGEAQMTPAADAVGGGWRGLGDPVSRLRTGWPGAADRLPDKIFQLVRNYG